MTSNFTADLGRSSGAQVTLVTRSGSNDFHGSLFEFYQTPRFHANEYNNIINRHKRPQFVQHIFGGSIGGPVYFPRFGEGGPTHLQRQEQDVLFYKPATAAHQPELSSSIAPFTLSRRATVSIVTYRAASIATPPSPLPRWTQMAIRLPGLTIRSYNVFPNPQGLGPDPTTSFHHRIYSVTQ